MRGKKPERNHRFEQGFGLICQNKCLHVSEILDLSGFAFKKICDTTAYQMGVKHLWVFSERNHRFEQGFGLICQNKCFYVSEILDLSSFAFKKICDTTAYQMGVKHLWVFSDTNKNIKIIKGNKKNF